jgi:hypothetical protein
MYNKKKSLLARMRIAMMAIVTILGIGGAFAMQKPQHNAAQTYGVLSTAPDDSGWIVTASSSGLCASAPARTCKVVSEVEPDANGFIQRSDALQTELGIYVP